MNAAQAGGETPVERSDVGMRPTPPVRQRSSASLYTFAWVVLAIGAAGYVALLYANGSLLEMTSSATSVASGVNTTPEQRGVNQRLARMEADLDTNTKAVARVVTDVADLRRADTDLATRMVAMEAWSAETAREGQALRTQNTAPTIRDNLGAQAGQLIDTAQRQGITALAGSDPTGVADQAVSGLARDIGTAAATARSAAPVIPVADRSTPVGLPADDNRIVGVTVFGDGARPAGSEALDLFDVALGAQPGATSALTAPAVFGETTPGTAVLRTVPVPNRQQYGIELATGPNKEAIQLTLDVLRELYGPVISPLSTRYVTSGGTSSDAYRLIAGPFGSATEAAATCEQLPIAREQCRPTTFAGAVL